MPINIDISAEFNKTRFLQNSRTIISPSGRSCCFLVIQQEPQGLPLMLKRIQFIDLINQSQAVFGFPDGNLLKINSIYWLTDHLLVFLSTDGTSFRQNMYRVNIKETPCIQKVCERVYVLPNEIFKETRIIVTPRTLYDGAAYITWVDGRTENDNCTALYLIPQNPNNNRLRLRKFAMILCTRNNPIFRKDKVMMDHHVSQEGRIMSTPFIRQNKLIFRICKPLYDWDVAFDEDNILYGAFLSVDVEKLQEVKGLDYEQKDIQNNTGSYKIHKWTELLKKQKWPFHVQKRYLQQAGKYIMFDSTEFGKRYVQRVNTEEHSFLYAGINFELKSILVLHPSGCILKLDPLEENGARYSLDKINKPWNSSRLEDIARRNVILNEEIDPSKKEDYINIICQE